MSVILDVEAHRGRRTGSLKELERFTHVESCMFADINQNLTSPRMTLSQNLHPPESFFVPHLPRNTFRNLNIHRSHQKITHRTELDTISDTRPIMVLHISGHLGVVNSAALRAMSISENVQDPPGGYYGRDGRERE